MKCMPSGWRLLSSSLGHLAGWHSTILPPPSQVSPTWQVFVSKSKTPAAADAPAAVLTTDVQATFPGKLNTPLYIILCVYIYIYIYIIEWTYSWRNTFESFKPAHKQIESKGDITHCNNTDQRDPKCTGRNLLILHQENKKSVEQGGNLWNIKVDMYRKQALWFANRSCRGMTSSDGSATLHNTSWQVQNVGLENSMCTHSTQSRLYIDLYIYCIKGWMSW